MTGDAQTELKWAPIYPANKRSKKELTRLELIQQGFLDDKAKLGGDLFEGFQDQGEVLREFTTPQECADAAAFWREEAT